MYHPALTGLGERGYLLGRDIGLATHIADVAAVFEYEDLQDAILVAHGNGGVVAAGCDGAGPRAGRMLVLLDAQVPRSGQSVFDVIGPDLARS